VAAVLAGARIGAFIMVIASLFDSVETNRARFMVEPLINLMAKSAGISHRSVQRIWAADGLKPHRVRLFKLSNDPQLA
jgi:hypothetical protein